MRFRTGAQNLLKSAPCCALPLGVLAACGFAPLNLWALSLIGLAGLLAILAKAHSARAAALIGWLWGVGHFSFGNNWIATAFTYQANMPAWLGWVGVVGLALYLAVFPALAAGAAWVIARRNAAALIPAFAACWIISEWLRSSVFTGYAWNPLAMAALGPFERPGLAALTPWLGTYALSGVMVLLAGCWWRAYADKRRDWRTFLLFLVPVLLILQPGAVRVPDPANGLPYTLIQPDLRQEDLDNPATFEQQFVTAAKLSLPQKPGQRRIVLWPESGVPDYLREGYPLFFYQQTTFAADPRLARARLARVIGPGAMLLTGTVDLELRHGAAAGVRNVVSVIDDHGRIAGSYAKAHLVPYGEYLPMRPILEPLGVSRLVPGSMDFWPGPGPQTLNLGAWGKAGVQICYEIVFSGQVVDRAHRPDYIFNPSNDGWFGMFGPPQHLAQARMRAIEEGLPVLRATTTGISAVIDADGIVRQFLPRGGPGRLDGKVPPAHPATLFAQWGNLLPLGWAALLLMISALAMRRRRD